MVPNGDAVFGPGAILIREKLQGFTRLDRFVRAVEENCATEVDFAGAVAHEEAISQEPGGRSVFDDRKRERGGTREPRQMNLFS